jgi:predicted transcriptional regulator
MSGLGALAVSLLLFGCALALHVVVWRIAPPRAYLLWFLKYWALLPLALVALYLAIAGTSEILTWLAGLLTYLALCACFILVYPAISMSSLSLEILHYLHRHGPQPVTALQLASQSGAAMIEARRVNLLESGVFRADDERLMLTAKGRLIASAIDTVRWLLAIPRGSGG